MSDLISSCSILFFFHVGLGKDLSELRTGTGQTRHDCPDRHRGDISNLLVGAFFQFAQGNDLAKLGRKLVDGRADNFAIVYLIEPACDSGIRIFRRVQLLIEKHILLVTARAFESGESGVAYDAQEPGATVLTAKTVEKTE